MEERAVQKSLKYLRALSDGTIGGEIEIKAAKGIRVVKAYRGYLLCNFTIHNSLADENGNWHVGAIATLIDTIGSAPIYSFTAHPIVSVNLCISYYSTAKVQEEVEVEAKVVGKRGRLTCAIVEVKKKENGELIALGNQWMTDAKINVNHQASKL